jgi:hypothetical protein
VNHTCPTCGSDDVHHSRPRSFGEKLRIQFTEKVPFRCYACGWRDWLPETPEPAKPRPDAHEQPTDIELEKLDPGPSGESDDADVIRR